MSGEGGRALVLASLGNPASYTSVTYQLLDPNGTQNELSVKSRLSFSVPIVRNLRDDSIDTVEALVFVPISLIELAIGDKFIKTIFDKGIPYHNYFVEFLREKILSNSCPANDIKVSLEWEQIVGLLRPIYFIITLYLLETFSKLENKPVNELVLRKVCILLNRKTETNREIKEVCAPNEVCKSTNDETEKIDDNVVEVDFHLEVNGKPKTLKLKLIPVPSLGTYEVFEHQVNFSKCYMNFGSNSSKFVSSLDLIKDYMLYHLFSAVVNKSNEGNSIQELQKNSLRREHFVELHHNLTLRSCQLLHLHGRRVEMY